MRPNRRILLAGAIILSSISQFSIAGVGFATRDLNPVLQPIYLPTQAPIAKENGWRVDNSLYITNTLQNESDSDESLVIDVENYRYELGFSYRRDQWLAQVSIPFVANNGGELDGLIDSWHHLFGLPEGDRDKFPKDDINIGYQRDGAVQFSQDNDTSGLGDLSIAIGFESQNETRYFIGIELPTGSESDFSGNEGVDFAIWVSREKRIDEKISLYGLLGLSIPADDGTLEGLIVDEIWVAQLGLEYRFNENVVGTVQLDMHSETIENSDLDAFGDSMQILLGLGFLKLIEDYRLDLFFSEDILVGSAPDITFGVRLVKGF